MRMAGISDEEMARISRELQEPADAATTMQAAVEVAVREIDGASDASLTIIRRGTVKTLAATSPEAQRADALQYELQEGPCLEAALSEDPVVHAADFTSEGRWPVWAERTHQETSYRSVMSIKLFTADGAIGAMNLYSHVAHSFTAEDRDAGLVIAAPIAVAIGAAQQLDDLRIALDSRTTISQAVGMLMERYAITADVAFSLLSRIASTTHVKLRDVAAELCETGDLPSDPRIDEPA
jgi:transcriptional regulator with GAF, ATPase, and Fis domain